jgi:hypothetical protein
MHPNATYRDAASFASVMHCLPHVTELIEFRADPMAGAFGG